MRIPLVPLIMMLMLCILTDAYALAVLRRRARNRLTGALKWGECISALVGYGAIAAAIAMPFRSGANDVLLWAMWLLWGAMTVFVPKIVWGALHLVSDLPALWGGRRLAWLARSGAAAAVLAFFTMWWGALCNRFNIRMEQVVVERADVPQAFDGMTIVQISDLHTGTYGNDTAFVSRLVDSVNASGADLIVFTGDIVNRRADELLPHMRPLSRLTAPLGVLSVMGNHDYGDYASWPSPQAKEADIETLKAMQTSMGWTMLNNASVVLHRGTDSIAVLGVENIGDPPFKTYGTLQKAWPAPGDSVFKILLSHNPAHWTREIRDRRDTNIALTLSGHTHAMQAEVLGASPAAWRYETWGGLYHDSNNTHSLYVNTGAGTVGFPARIGATPEVTVITLRRTTQAKANAHPGSGHPHE